MQKQEIFVLGFKKVGPFTNKETGEIVEGVNVHYIEKSPYSSEKESGHIPSKIFLSNEKANSVVRNGQGFYHLLLRIDLNGSKPRLVTEGFEFIKKGELKLV